MRQLVSSGSPFEPTIGFSRAVRVGPHVFVSATAAIGADGKTVGIGDTAAQARRVFEIINEALKAAGASLKDVVRTRIFLMDIDDWKAVAQVHGEIFADIRPATFFVQIGRFIDPDWRVEIEVEAVVEGASA
jgi:enamine deaminase RidA (YjgF/YER057c/UK114 family)